MKHATRIDPRDGAPAGTNGLDLNHGRAHHETKLNGGLRGQGRLALRDQGHIKARAPHVTRDDIGKPCHFGDFRTRDHARSRTRECRANGELAGGRGRHHAPIALHNQELAQKPLLSQDALQARQIAPHHRLQSGVQTRRGATLKLPNFRQHLCGHTHVRVGPKLLYASFGAQLIEGVGVRVDKKHTNGLTALCQQVLRLGAHLLDVDLGVDLARGEHALVDLESQISGDDGHKTALEPPGLRAIPAAHLQHIAKAACGDEAGLGDFALKQRIRGHGGAMHQGRDGGGHAAGIILQALGMERIVNRFHAAHKTLRLLASGGGHFDDVGFRLIPPIEYK